MIPQDQAFGKNFTKQAYWLHHQIYYTHADSPLLLTPNDIAFWIKQYGVLSIAKIDAFLLEHYFEDWKHILPYTPSNSYIDNQKSVQILDPNVVNMEEELDDEEKAKDEIRAQYNDWYDTNNGFVKE